MIKIDTLPINAATMLCILTKKKEKKKPCRLHANIGAWCVMLAMKLA